MENGEIHFECLFSQQGKEIIIHTIKYQLRVGRIENRIVSYENTFLRAPTQTN